MKKGNGYSYTVNEDKKSGSVEVTVELEQDLYQKALDQAYTKLAPTVKIAGFRPGAAPKANIVAKLGTKLLGEAINTLFPNVASEILVEEKLNPITTLEYDFTGDDQKDELSFKFTFVKYPEVKLGDLSKIKVKTEDVNVTEEDVNTVLRRLFAHQEGHSHNHEHNHEDEEHLHLEVDLDKITSEQVEKVGIPNIKTMEDLRKDVKVRLEKVKIDESKMKAEDEALKKAIEISDIPVPPSFLAQQVQMEMDEYKAHFEKLGVDMNIFHEAQGKKMEQVEEQKATEVEQRIKSELLLNAIAQKYELYPTDLEINTEIESITDPEVRANFDSAQGRRHITSLLIQQRGARKLLEITSK